jgi:hypothetical protein
MKLFPSPLTKRPYKLEHFCAKLFLVESNLYHWVHGINVFQSKTHQLFYQQSFIEFTRVSVAILLKLCRQGQCNKNLTVVTHRHFTISHFQNGLAYFSIRWNLIYIGGVYLNMTCETVSNIDSGCTCLCYLVHCNIYRDSLSYLCRMAQGSQGKCYHC